MATVLSGNAAAAWGFRLSRVLCYPYYPITPSTACSQQISRWVYDGVMEAVTINAESEHSAASQIIAAGKSVRAGTATSSKGLLYMIEVLENAAGGGIPCGLFIGNRATGAPINIWADNSDAYAMRDSGAIQIFAADAQEALDGIVQGYRIAEDPRVRLPFAVNLRGFTGTHAYEGVEIPSQESVDRYLPPFAPLYPLFDADRPVTYGAMLSAHPYRRHKRNQMAALARAIDVAAAAGRQFGEVFNRPYGLFDWIGDEKAELVVAVLGESSCAGEVVARHLQGKEGIPGVALLKIRLFSPFPGKWIADALARAGTKAVVVLDEGLNHGAVFPPLAQRVATTVHLHLGSSAPRVASVIGGLGGSEITQEHFQLMFNLADNIAAGKPYRTEPYWLDIDEDPIFVETQDRVNPKLWKKWGEIWKQQKRKAGYFAPVLSDSHEIRIYSRAGQGAITSAVGFTGAGIEHGYQLLTVPAFGSERRGAIITTDTLVNFRKEQRVRSFSRRWDVVTLYDDTILHSPEHRVLDGLKKGGTLLVNTSRLGIRKIREILKAGESDVRVLTVPASEISQRLGLSHCNMAMLGALHKAYDRVPFDAALRYYERHVPRPREASLEAIRLGFAETSDREIRKTGKERRGLSVPPEFLEWRPAMHLQESWPSPLEEIRS
ncbi:MAG TPA: 2-oxoacid:acceptor oxidoreductase family protein [candidate division Zixibacteria bacterium]|nr:2-oxoacid:acceptor oxidoreductase family protein [candidate division Zixibacteria bacterium]